ncbi:secretogranin-1 isoform X2 [Tamandua tetradactyla]
MVTRCIVQVLANVLLQSNAPPINPICRYALKKSTKEVMDEERNENENAKYEVRLLRDPDAASAVTTPSSREEAGAPGEGDTGGLTMKDKEKWPQGGRHSGERAGEPQETLHPSNSQVTKEANSEKGEEAERKEGEGEKYQKRERGEDGSEEKHLEESGKTQNTFLDKRDQAAAKNKADLVDQDDKHGGGRSEEKTHSRETSSQESGEEEERRQEEHSKESASQSRSREDSEESEEDPTSEVTKRRLRPRHHHGRSRPDRSSQERKPPSEERRHSLEEPGESNVGKANLEEKRSQHSTHYRVSEEEPEYREEVRNYPGVQAPADLEGERFGGRSEGYRVPRPPSEESQEEEDKRNHPPPELDNMMHRPSHEKDEGRVHEAGKGHHQRGETGAYFHPEPREEKRFLGEVHYHMQERQMDKARRHPQLEWKGQDRDDLNYGERNGEEGAPKWQQQEVLQDSQESREEAELQDKQYAPSHTPEKRKRLGDPFNPYYGPPQWKSSDRFERKDNTNDNFLEGEEENGLTLNEKNFFPEYNYDWWEKKPFADDVNWGYEKRSLLRAPKLDMKRQYDRVAELDQLLHYRKKSAEFPDFYDSEEQMSTGHATEKEKDGIGQRVLTEEEEKKLDNLAAMDLELQKIAEKFSGNRKG